jgi:hypothetical protein
LIVGYFLYAVIAKLPLLEVHSGQFALAAVVPLSLGLALIPVTDDFLDEIGSDGDRGRFEQLTPTLAAWVASLSAADRVAYVEAEFHGGTGGQGAVVWYQGAPILERLNSQEAINDALRLLGISRGVSHDEFVAVGLPRHRDTSDWLDDAIPKTRNA